MVKGRPYQSYSNLSCRICVLVLSSVFELPRARIFPMGMHGRNPASRDLVFYPRLFHSLFGDRCLFQYRLGRKLSNPFQERWAVSRGVVGGPECWSHLRDWWILRNQIRNLDLTDSTIYLVTYYYGTVLLIP
jgi:hypothetical protein